MFATEWFSQIVTAAQELLPRILGAAAVLAAGFLAALILRFVVSRLLAKVFDRTGRSEELQAAVDGTNAGSTIPKVVSAFVFWITVLLFASAAIESLGFTVVTRVLSELAYYLPNVLAAVVVVLAGLVVGALGRRAATGGARSAGVARPEYVGKATQVLAVLIAAVIAMQQIGINAQLLVVLLAIGIGTSFAAASLAFGIGARTAVGNIIARHYFNQTYRVGQRVRIGNIEGEIIKTTPTSVLLATIDGRMLVPATRFTEEPSLLVTTD